MMLEVETLVDTYMYTLYIAGALDYNVRLI